MYFSDCLSCWNYNSANYSELLAIEWNPFDLSFLSNLVLSWALGGDCGDRCWLCYRSGGEQKGTWQVPSPEKAGERVCAAWTWLCPSSQPGRFPHNDRAGLALKFSNHTLLPILRGKEPLWSPSRVPTTALPGPRMENSKTLCVPSPVGDLKYHFVRMLLEPLLCPSPNPRGLCGVCSWALPRDPSHPPHLHKPAQNCK